MSDNPERDRLIADPRRGGADWKRWGTYLSERAWGTVREDYSANGDSWNYFPHDHARSRAYRWNEDGIGGFCDEKQHICLAVALWNEKDAILKERMFGLSNLQGNHGEDVKEYYFFLDGTPTHSYMKMLYKYPQVAYPYDDLVEENARRDQAQPEYELFDALQDTFTANRYFDVFIEYAKASPEDMLCRITAVNRGPDAAPIHVLPHLWYRNRWSWEPAEAGDHAAIGPGAAHTSHPTLGDRWWYVRTSDKQSVALLFTENDTNFQRIDDSANKSPYVKDGINDGVVGGQKQAVNAKQAASWPATRGPSCRPGARFRSRSASRQRAGRSVRRFRRRLHQPHRRGGRVLRALHPPASAQTSSWSAGRPLPDCCGRSSTTTTTSIAGSKATRPSRRRPKSVGRAATTAGRSCTTPTSS